MLVRVYQDIFHSNGHNRTCHIDFSEAWIPEFRLEADAAYFTSNCHDLTGNETLAVKQEFANMLIARGVCMKGKSSQVLTLWDMWLKSKYRSESDPLSSISWFCDLIYSQDMISDCLVNKVCIWLYLVWWALCVEYTNVILGSSVNPWFVESEYPLRTMWMPWLLKRLKMCWK